MVAGVVKLVGRVGGDVDGFTGDDGGLCSSEGGFDLALEEDEGLFEVVAMRWWAAAGRDVHVDQAEAFRCVFSGEENGVGVSY